jgi:uncharacterized RDD family membrane protein YckC
MRPGRRVGSAALAAAVLVPAAAVAQTAPLAREALELFEAQLDRAVGQVSRPATGVVLGRAESARGYHLPGYGAVFVLTPRVLPREGNVLAFRQRTSPQVSAQFQIETRVEGPGGPDEEAAARLADHVRQVLAAPKKDDRTFTVRAAPPAGDREADELMAIEQQVLDFQREAEEARQHAEREFERISRDLRDRLATPPEPSGPGTAPTASGPHAPAAPFLPVPKAPPAPVSAAAPVAATVPVPPVEPPPPGAPGPPPVIALSPLPQPPPWRFWFDGGPPDPRTPAKVIADVRAAVIATLESAGARLQGLAPDEYVTVAVDFVPAGVFVSQVRPARTVVVRARKQDLDARLRGQLSADDLRRRVEVSEY